MCGLMLSRPTIVDDPLGDHDEANPPPMAPFVKVAALTVLAHQLLLTGVGERLLTSWSKRLTALKQPDRHMAASYMAAMFHHLIVVPISLKTLYDDATLPEGAQNDYTMTRMAMAVTAGFFISDFVDLIRTTGLKQKDMLFHHILGMAVVFGGAATSRRAPRWNSWMMSTEISSVFFATMYLTKKMKMIDSVVNKIATAGFILFFFLVRVVGMPLAVGHLMLHPQHTPDWESLGLSAWCLPTATVLQWYWFALIVQKIVPALMGAKVKARVA